MQSFENQRLADRRDAIRRGRRDLRILDGLVQRVRFLPADSFGLGARADLCRLADRLRNCRTDTRERSRQELRHRSAAGVLEHRDQLAEFDAVRMRLDLLRLGGKLRRGSPERSSVAVRIDVMDRDVRIRDRRLLQVLVDAAAATLIAPFEFDRDARAAVQLRGVAACSGVGIRSGRIVRYPFDAVIADVLPCPFPRQESLRRLPCR